jgi:hypothetical protein
MCRQALRTGLSVAGKIALNVPDRHVPGPVVGGGLGTVDPTELGADDGCEEDGGRAVPVPAVPPAAVTGGVVPVPEAAVVGAESVGEEEDEACAEDAACFGAEHPARTAPTKTAAIAARFPVLVFIARAPG